MAHANERLVGTLGANTVSGEVAATGHITKASVDSVSGNVVIDTTGPVSTISTNTVSGNTTLRLDEGLPANYTMRSLTGRVLVDGVVRSSSGPTNHVGSSGELSGMFVDIRTNGVSGDVTEVDVATLTATRTVKVGRYPWGAAIRPTP